MFIGKGRFEWQRTASFMALYANAHRGRGCPAFKAEKMMPPLFTAPVQKVKLNEKDSMEFLKRVFVKD